MACGRLYQGMRRYILEQESDLLSLYFLLLKDVSINAIFGNRLFTIVRICMFEHYLFFHTLTLNTTYRMYREFECLSMHIRHMHAILITIRFQRIVKNEINLLIQAFL